VVLPGDGPREGGSGRSAASAEGRGKGDRSPGSGTARAGGPAVPVGSSVRRPGLGDGTVGGHGRRTTGTTGIRGGAPATCSGCWCAAEG